MSGAGGPDRERLAAIDRVFDAVLEMAPGERRDALEKVCAGDAALREEVESLLRAADLAPGPLDGTLGGLLPGFDLSRALEDDEAAEHRALIGRHLGPYRVESLLAVGGMGEVYIAEDSRMRRRVALKLLPAKYTRDEGRVSRFQREARAASALNHPGIVTVYEVGQEQGIHFIASEYVEGETLRQLVGRGPLEVQEAVQIGGQVAGALAAAHAAGLVHRDIKPENVMLRPDGFVKVLDFGLVKLIEGSGRDPRASVTAATATGTLLGTVHYMSPEQARGEEVDARSDLFALGAVLYELLTGSLAFQGSTLATTFDAILNREPVPLRSVRPEVSQGLEAIVTRLLVKDRGRRYQSAAEVRAVLLGLAGGHSTAPAFEAPAVRRAVPGEPSRPVAARLALGAAAAAALAGLGWGAWRLATPRPEAARWQDAVVTRLTDQRGAEVFPSLSPDGAFVVYEGRGSSGSDIFLQRVGSRRATNLTGEAGIHGPAPGGHDTQPALSPDGHRIAFRRTWAVGGSTGAAPPDTAGAAASGIYLMSETGEAVRQLTTFGYNPAWSPDGTRIACAENGVDGTVRTSIPSRLFVVEVASGRVSELAVPDAVQPSWSPGGRRLAFWGVHKRSQSDLFTTALDGSGTVQVTDDAFLDVAPVWSPRGDFLYFLSNRKGPLALWRIAMDEASGRPAGRPELVPTPAWKAHHVSLSRDGRHLALGSLSSTQNIEMLAFDPATGTVGQPRPATLISGEVTHPAVSPDGTLLAYQTAERPSDIFVQRLGDSVPNLVTPEATNDLAPRFAPDGGTLVYYSNRSGTYQVWASRSDGSGAVQLTHVPPPGAVLPVVSPDGSRLAFSYFGGRTVLMPFGPAGAQPAVTETPPNPPHFAHFVAQAFSPDGRRLSGTGYDTGGRGSLRNTGLYTYDVEAGCYEKLSSFGTHTRWLRDGRRLLFVHEDKLYLVEADSKDVRVIHDAAPRSLRAIDLASDDRTIFVSAETTEADVWLLSLD